MVNNNVNNPNLKKKYYTIKLKKCGTIHICYMKEIKGIMYYVAPNHFHKWKVNSKNIEVLI